MGLQVKQIFFLICIFLLISACNQKIQTGDSQHTPSENTGSNTNPQQPDRTPSSGDSDSSGADHKLNFEQAQEAAKNVAILVDRTYNLGELLKTRSLGEGRTIDLCPTEFNSSVPGNIFADRIGLAIYKHFENLPLQIGSVRSQFGLTNSTEKDVWNSLVSHPFCQVSAESFNKVYQGKHIPKTETIAKAQKFTELLNRYRNQSRQGDSGAQLKLFKTWTKFMMCLGYMESLTSADSTESDSLARSLNFRRPAGVNLHNDHLQTDPNSVLGIGIFQNSNVVLNGETYSCVKDWNRQFPQCQIPINTSPVGMIPILGSSYQTFNTYCGVSHITRMFGVQINTQNIENTHPQNRRGNQLASPQDRCVTPFTNNMSYNHFGPLQNVHDFTLDEVLTCTLQGENL